MHKLVFGLLTGVLFSTRMDCSWYVNHMENFADRLTRDLLPYKPVIRENLSTKKDD